MEDIPIGFGIKIGNSDEMSKIERGHSDNIDCSEDINIREYSWVSMRTFNPMTSELAKNTDIKNKFHENNRIVQLESKLSETESKLSATESKLSEVLKFQSETEFKLSKLDQTNAMLNDCLSRLAKLEKLG
jgi:vacuolar-type H+-ATPase subunit I/STV1